MTMTEHQIAEPVLAYPCYGIYASYDANAPHSRSVLLVATEELAKEVCQFLNKDPQHWSDLAFVEGFEWSKRFRYIKEYSTNKDEIETDFEKTCFRLKEENGDDEDEDE